MARHPKHPCTPKCDKRAKLTKKYGSCHNEHCPYGWNDYTDSLKGFYKDKELEYETRKATAQFIKLTNHNLLSKKK